MTTKIYDELQKELSSALRQLNSNFGYDSYDVIVSHIEINYQHGVGVLVQRIFPESSNFFSIRSKNIYDGHQDFGSQKVCLDLENTSIYSISQKIQKTLNNIVPNRLLSIPYFPEDYLITLAIKKLYNCPLCLFIMDDQNIFSKNVSDSVIEELIDKADLCLGISRPLCDAYQEKFKKKSVISLEKSGA